jgi:hypothetical protein
MTKRQKIEQKKALRSHVVLAAIRHPAGGAHADKRRERRNAWRSREIEVRLRTPASPRSVGRRASISSRG